MSIKPGDKIRKTMKDGRIARGVYLEPRPPKNIITGLDTNTICVVDCGLIRTEDGESAVWIMPGWEPDQ